MRKVPISFDKNVLVGFDTNDDAGVYKISQDLALVQTLDFFTPIVDDPFVFGQIAAANALSDVYAMGGKPLTAMNIVAFPLTKFPLDLLTQILQGGLDILNKAGVQLLGGHSIEDNELKYGLSVTGTVHPNRVIKNNGCQVNDLIILTKPLGTGIIGTALKANMIDPVALEQFISTMVSINDVAGRLMLQHQVNACTDVTGFGLAGHLREMLANDPLEIVIESEQLPILSQVKEYLEFGLIPGGLYRNQDYVKDIFCASSVPEVKKDLIFDPQTSGGLLISLPEKEALLLLDEIKTAGVPEVKIIGSVKSADQPKISLI